MALVTLAFSLSPSSSAEEAEVLWVDGSSSTEVRYATLHRGETVEQQTFPGHRWVVRAPGGGGELWRGEAAEAPALQRVLIETEEGADGTDRPAGAVGSGADLSEEEEDISEKINECVQFLMRDEEGEEKPEIEIFEDVEVSRSEVILPESEGGYDDVD